MSYCYMSIVSDPLSAVGPYMAISVLDWFSLVVSPQGAECTCRDYMIVFLLVHFHAVNQAVWASLWLRINHACFA